MRLLILLPLLACIGPAGAVHVRGGEFRYTHVSDYTYSIEFHYYTRSSAPADSPELIIAFGDGTLDTVPRIMIQDLPGGIGCYGDLRYSIYQADHTFRGPGSYVITMEDFNRNGGIINIPNSIGVSFCVSTMLVINDLLGPNNSVVFNNPQPVIIQEGWDLSHALDPYDQDGDSLSFELIQPLGNGCQPISGYQFPDPGFTLDLSDGSWYWSSATILGEYNVTIRATEWRDGQMIGQVTRDMTVCVLPFVGIEENGIPSFTISPTLTDGPIRITSDHQRPLPLSIHDSAGRLVMEKVLPPGEQWLDLGGLPQGMYMVRVQEPGGGTSSVQVVKH